MKKKIGIPKALLYYEYRAAYDAFFNCLGAEVVLSGPSRPDMEKGCKLVPDEVCLPVKNYFGHIINLKEKNVDFIFLPRFMKTGKESTFCPKIIGLPDLVKNVIHGLPSLIEINIDFTRKFKLCGEIIRTGRKFNSGPVKTYMAWKAALNDYNKFSNGNSEPPSGGNKINIAVLGHPYNLSDPDLNLNLIDKLREKEINIFMPDMVPRRTRIKEADELPKKVFWTLSRDITGAAKYFVKHPGIDGIINIASFACGPDSITGELISYLVDEYGKKPYLMLVLDEHTGTAGLETRLEAFIEMIKMGKKRGKAN